MSFIVKENFRYLALLFSALTFGIVLSAIESFSFPTQGFSFVENISIGSYRLKFGIDGISLIFIFLTSVLTLSCLAINWKKPASYLALFLLLESIVIAFFTSLDLISFYIFFEASLIPLFFIIGIWGSDNRIYAAFKFFLYTFTGSIFLLLAILYLLWNGYSTDITTLINANLHLTLLEQKWLWLALFIAFAVKIPMIPFHTWLPDAHVQAPTAGSVMLAGILIKMGAYGFLRLSIPMFPEVSQCYANLIFTLSVIATIYSSLVALAQTDIKKVIAYSSIAHMGFVTAGIFSFNIQGMAGGVFQMFSHGVISSALFLCIGAIYDRKHTRNIANYQGLMNNMPFYSTLFIIFTMASIGLPGTSGFIGELLSIIGVFQTSKITAALIAIGTVLGAVYMLWLCKRIIWGTADDHSIRDISINEISALMPLLAITIILGLQPNLIMIFIEAPVNNLINLINK